EKLARGTDERAAHDVLAITRRLADEHDLRTRHTLAEHGLRRAAEQAAAAATGRRLTRGRQRRPGRQEVRGAVRRRLAAVARDELVGARTARLARGVLALGEQLRFARPQSQQRASDGKLDSPVLPLPQPTLEC